MGEKYFYNKKDYFQAILHWNTDHEALATYLVNLFKDENKLPDELKNLYNKAYTQTNSKVQNFITIEQTLNEEYLNSIKSKDKIIKWTPDYISRLFLIQSNEKDLNKVYSHA